MKILVVSDAWEPQINGVVRTLQATKGELEQLGHQVLIVGPDLLRRTTISLPFYREIVVEFFARKRISDLYNSFLPDSLHIATEGPLGWAARSLCLSRGWAFTTAYHTRFPEYCAARVPIFVRAVALRCAYAILRWFHSPSSAVMVPTGSVQRELSMRGFQNLVRWSRGVEVTRFVIDTEKDYEPYRRLNRPILICVSRVSREKNLEAFLSLTTSGTKVVVGSGPDLEVLSARFPDVFFLGRKEGKDLAEAYAAADLFVFPSRSDTFGLVLLEACASGLRVAAYKVAGPQDVFDEPDTGNFVVLKDNLQEAVQAALKLSDAPEGPRSFAERHSWKAATVQFISYLIPIDGNYAKK
jgi:glycosyltransferase involved in cell wall biosynthesis